MTAIRRYVVLTGAVALIALSPRPAPAQDLSSQIVGIWKVKSVECVDSGAYAIEGGTVTITYDDPTNFPPTVLGREVSVSGNLMTLKSMPVVSKMARSALVCTVVAEKSTSNGSSVLLSSTSAAGTELPAFALQRFRPESEDQLTLGWG
jgi:hypothetical protein